MGVSTPIFRKKNKVRTKKMEKAQKIREIKWLMCLTLLSIDDSIAPY